MSDSNPEMYVNVVWLKTTKSPVCLINVSFNMQFFLLKMMIPQLKPQACYNCTAIAIAFLRSPPTSVRAHVDDCNMRACACVMCQCGRGFVNKTSRSCAHCIFMDARVLSVWHLAIPNRIDTWLPCSAMMFSPQNACVMRACTCLHAKFNQTLHGYYNMHNGIGSALMRIAYL